MHNAPKTVAEVHAGVGLVSIWTEGQTANEATIFGLIALCLASPQNLYWHAWLVLHL